METTHLWHKRHLSGLKISLLSLLLALACLPARAQVETRGSQENLAGYDDRFLTYGFTLGGHTSTLRPKFSEAFADPSFSDTLNIIPGVPFGFSIGFLANFRLAQYLDFRVMPKVAFYDYTLKFETRQQEATTRDALADFTTIDIPLSLKYKSQRRGNHRMFITGGMTPIIDVTGKKQREENTEGGLRLTGNNLTADVGIGADFYFPLFKFSPEIRYSYGVRDVLQNKENQLGRAFDRLGTHIIGVYLVFN
ncbi:type IX secretion/gliding motility protein PorT/SprT [Cesiribacter andamanensis]|uniref:Outer membrane protein beta-barrel domain-containing protein n=1 Tax=Cesiribacter andamanensis AMV16 TaxID=1279009 RepID=M7NPE7_9BACT|nr:porin family protein [Cesiribacter andamanensis]EMR03595.1 hypothetical protein ADICEAN_01276 [Cesiribacter andamanensis AMV16]